MTPSESYGRWRGITTDSTPSRAKEDGKIKRIKEKEKEKKVEKKWVKKFCEGVGVDMGRLMHIHFVTIFNPIKF